MKKMILAVALLLCFVLVAASCNPDNPAELKTNENGTPVTQAPTNGENNGDSNNMNNGGGIQMEECDDEEGFGELIPLG